MSGYMQLNEHSALLWKSPVDTTPNYPLSLLSFNFDCLTRESDVIVIASSRHFGVLIPVSHLPPRVTSCSRDELHDQMIKNVVDAFYELAVDYTEASAENDLLLPLPDPDQLGNCFFPTILLLAGKVSADDKDQLSQPLILQGEYIFVAEQNVDISEFLIEIGDHAKILH